MYSTEETNVHTTSKKAIENILADHKIISSRTSETNNQKEHNLKNKITILDKEINLDPSKTIMSKTDARGVIEYANDYFMEISGYEEYELMGQPHNVIRHPDMPQIIFKLLWERLKEGKNIHAFVKNLSKDGRYYWVITNFETKYNEEGDIKSHYSRRKAAPKNTIYTIEKLYKTLRSIELSQGLTVAENYFNGLLEEKGMTYDAFVLSILNVDQNTLATYFSDANYPAKKTKKKGLLGRLFK